MKAYLLPLLALAIATPAHADTTAVYKTSPKTIQFNMTVEIADNGDVRYQISSGRTYGLVIKGVDYFVEVGAHGPIVDRVDDLMTAQREAMAAIMPDFAQKFQQRDATKEPSLVASGKVTINGRVGRAYSYASQSKTAKPVAFVVMSDDPDLAPLGKVMANQFGKSLTMFSGMLGDTPGMFKEMDQILRNGTPLRFAGMELFTVNHANIDPKRFDLPAAPETLDQIRARMKPLPPAPTATPEKL